jgi:transcriptional regulator with XRE-family HTH domain
MKTFAPKDLHGAQLRLLMESAGLSALETSKFLKVTERSIWRWLADDSAPFAVLATLWHESHFGRETVHRHVTQGMAIERGLSNALRRLVDEEKARMGRLLAISDTGAANDPLLDGPVPWRGQSIPIDSSDAPPVTADYLRRRN